MLSAAVCFAVGAALAGQAEPGAVIAAGSLSGAHLGATLAYTTGSSRISTFAQAGGLVGSAATFAWTRRPLPEGVGARSLSAAGLGTWAGLMLAQATMPAGGTATLDRLLLGSAVGDLAGWGLGLAAPERTPSGWAVIDEVALTSWMLADAASVTMGWQSPEARPRRARLALGATVIATGSALAFQDPSGPRVDPVQAALWQAHGAWLGTWAPRLAGWDATDRQVFTSAELGGGVGWAVGALLPDPAHAPPVSAVPRSIAGAALGRGLPLLVGGERAERVSILGMGVGELAGHLSAVPIERPPSGHGMLVGVGLGWTAWQAYAWPVALEPIDDAARGQGAALTASALGLGATIAAQNLDETQRSAAALAGSAALWSSGVGLLGAIGVGLGEAPAMGVSLGAGNLALGATWMLARGRSMPRSSRLLTMHGGALVGGGAVAWACHDLAPTHRARATLVGALSGLALGAVVPLPEPDLSAARLPRSLGGASARVNPWVDQDGNPGVLLGFSYARE